MTHRDRPSQAGAYLSTISIAACNVIATVIVSAILSRAWSMADFLSYNVLNRYLNLVFALTTFNIGFGMVRYASADVFHRIFATAAMTCLALCALVFGLLTLFASQVFQILHAHTSNANLILGYSFLWVVAQSFVYIVLAHLRSSGQICLANILHFFARGLAVLALSLVAWKIYDLSVYEYYAAVGVLLMIGCIGAMLWQSEPISFRFDWTLLWSMLGFSSSRFLDAITKGLTGVALLTLLISMGHGTVAGKLALMLTILRGLEALCQPLVLMVFSDQICATSPSDASRQVQTMWDISVLVMVAAIALSAVFAEPILRLWLGAEFSSLGPEFSVAVVVFAPTVAVILLRGYLDAEYRISPISILYLASSGIVLVAASVLVAVNCLTLMNILIAIAIGQWLQIAAVVWLLRRHHRLQLFEGALLASSVRGIVHKWTT